MLHKTLIKPASLARTTLFGAGVAALTLAIGLGSASAAEKVRFMTSWKAQAEHGGYYQALATGLYKKHGLDVSIRPGGPQMNVPQMIAANAIDFGMLSSNDDLLNLLKSGAKVKAVMAGFQKSPRILITHPGSGIKKLSDMKGKPILMSSSSINTMFAWLKAKYGFKDSQIRKYTFNVGPFLANKSAIQQGYLSSEPYIIKKKAGFTPTVFLLADYGYDTYASLIGVPVKWIETKPKAVQAFVDASIEGWYSFLYGDPAPAIKLIKKDNPDMTDDIIQYSMRKMKEAGIVDSGDAKKFGIGAMTKARWKSHFMEAASQGVYPKDMDYTKAYTLKFVNKGHGLKSKKPM